MHLKMQISKLHSSPYSLHPPGPSFRAAHCFQNIVSADCDRHLLEVISTDEAFNLVLDNFYFLLRPEERASINMTLEACIKSGSLQAYSCFRFCLMNMKMLQSSIPVLIHTSIMLAASQRVAELDSRTWTDSAANLTIFTTLIKRALSIEHLCTFCDQVSNSLQLIALDIKYPISQWFQKWNNSLGNVSTEFWKRLAEILPTIQAPFSRIVLAVHDVISKATDIKLDPRAVELLLIFVHGKAMEDPCAIEYPPYFLHSATDPIAVSLSEKLTDIDASKRLFIYSTIASWPDMNLLSNLRDVANVSLFVETVSSMHKLWPLMQRKLEGKHFTRSQSGTTTLRYRILSAVASLNESTAGFALYFLKSRQKNWLEILSEFLLAISQLFGDPLCLNSMEFFEPIPVQRGDTLSSELLHAGALRLRGNPDKGQIPEVLELVYTDEVKRIQLLLEDYRENARFADIHGPPGIGKSIMIADWIEKIVPTGIRVTWISCEGTNKSASVLIGTDSFIISARVNVEFLFQVAFLNNLSSITIADGVRKHHDDVCEIIKEWSATNHTCGILVRSDSSKPTNGAMVERIRGWELSDYRKALTIKRFRDSILELFAKDDLFADEFDFFNSLPDKTEKLKEEILNDCIEKKIKIAGGSARFMFAISSISVKKIIDEKLRTVISNLDQSCVQPVTFDAINTVFAYDAKGTFGFVSEYAENQFFEMHGLAYYKEHWLVVTRLGNVVIGIYFEKAIIQMIREGRSLKVKAIKGGASEADTWSVNNHAEYSNLKSVDVSDSMRRAIQQKLIRKDQNFYCCPEKRICCQKYRALEKLDKHILEKHIPFCKKALKIRQDKKKEIENMSKLREIQDDYSLERLDISTAKDMWLIPRGNQKVFDLIRVINKKEIWFIQVTVSHYHSLCDSKIFRNILSILNAPLAEIKYVVLVPSKVHFNLTSDQRQELDNQGVSFALFKIHEDSELAFIQPST